MGSCAPSRESALRVQLAPALLSPKLSTAVPTSFQPQVSPWLRNHPPLPSPRRIPIPHLPCPLSPPPHLPPSPTPSPVKAMTGLYFPSSWNTVKLTACIASRGPTRSGLRDGAHLP